MGHDAPVLNENNIQVYKVESIVQVNSPDIKMLMLIYIIRQLLIRYSNIQGLVVKTKMEIVTITLESFSLLFTVNIYNDANINPKKQNILDARK